MSELVGFFFFLTRTFVIHFLLLDIFLYLQAFDDPLTLKLIEELGNLMKSVSYNMFSVDNTTCEKII